MTLGIIGMSTLPTSALSERILLRGYGAVDNRSETVDNSEPVWPTTLIPGMERASDNGGVKPTEDRRRAVSVRTEPCACGAAISAIPDEVAAVVAAHVRAGRHQAWRVEQ